MSINKRKVEESILILLLLNVFEWAVAIYTGMSGRGIDIYPRHIVTLFASISALLTSTWIGATIFYKWNSRY